ncbi:30S ribosomal protein S6 [Mucilaginibacter sp. L3T2-6]|uniref:30S ribosomal protein S6 n=1 Tax=Mucilaginibacter sp. L3T2-6 TaxID=3062491 RepID=UPI002674F18A|nr:30S ribosomal protein S6 [Mucilaginibacter sp. L3T2-6]MDO3641793.1 30S ribosomal protein S6 [Mucilaginibacter sp. L3T2-6]MDV6214529.1 30S ribosomal protein S6 [Mucilaginibacter sp. L3T2-6]
MSKRYETVFILSPVLSEDQAKEAAAKFRKILTGLGCEITHEENWGLRAGQPARPVSEELLELTKKTTGYYRLLEYTTANPNAVPDLEIAFKRDERVLRFMTVRLGK